MSKNVFYLLCGRQSFLCYEVRFELHAKERLHWTMWTKCSFSTTNFRGDWEVYLRLNVRIDRHNVATTLMSVYYT